MKTIVDERHVADSLHETAEDAECGTNDAMNYANTGGDYYQIGEFVELYNIHNNYEY